MNGRERYFNTVNFQNKIVKRSHGPVVKDRTFFARGGWNAASNPGVASSSFFSLSSSFYLLAFYCLFSLLTLLASRDFCKNVFLVCPRRGMKQQVERLYTASVYIRNIQYIRIIIVEVLLSTHCNFK